MRILHISETYAEVGGAETYLLGIMQGLEELGHQNSIIYHRRHPQTVHVEGRGEYYVPLGDAAPPPTLVRRLLAGSSDEWYLYGQAALDQARDAVSRTIEQENPDVIYLHMVFHPAIVNEAVRHRPTVAYVHGFYPCCPSNTKLWRRSGAVCTAPFGLKCAFHLYQDRCDNARHPLSVYRKLLLGARRKAAYQQVNQLLVPSRYIRDLLLQNGFRSERIAVLPYFIERSSDNPVAGAQLSEGERNILYVGRLAEEKGFPYLLQALALVEAPCRLVVAGDGKMMPVYRRLAVELGLCERVEFRGWLDAARLERAYAESLLVAMPSIFPEPFGQAGPEAMLRGKPVVAFAVGGIPEWLHHEQNGLLVQPGNVSGLAQAMERLLRDPALAVRLGENGRWFVLEHYGREKHRARLEEVLQNVIG